MSKDAGKKSLSANNQKHQMIHKSQYTKSEVPRPCLRRSGFAQAGTGRGFREM